MFIDDRWLYEQEEILPPPKELNLSKEGPEIRRPGKDITLVSCSYPLLQCLEAARALGERGIEAEVIDLRVLNPLVRGPIIHSVRKTGRLLAVDGDWATCGMAAEVITSAVEGVEPEIWKKAPARITLPDAPAPTSKPLEQAYYFQVEDIVQKAMEMMSGKK